MAMKKVTGAEMAREMSDFVNNMCCDVAGFVEAMAHEHPTLQQNFMRLTTAFIEEMAKKDDGDLRNAASVRLAKQFVRLMEERGTTLPSI